MARVTESFNAGWYFTKDRIDPSAADFAKMELVTLPHTWNRLDGQDGGNDYYRSLCWYAKEFSYTPSDNELYIEFMGVSQIAAVYVNGKKVGDHEAGFSIFRVNITGALKEGVNIIAVSADNSENEHTYPQYADFTFFGGIYRDVNLITVPKAHFELDCHGTPGITVTPIVNNGTATVTVKGSVTAADGVSYRLAIKAADDTVVKHVDTSEPNAVFEIDNPHLWDGVADPYLYTAVISMVRGNEIVDEVRARFGIRSFSVDPETGFYLNGKSYPLRGVSRHQDRENMGWAITSKEHREDMELIAEMGCNTVRLAHYQHDQQFYDLCDEYGMVVWAEIPFISRFLEGPAARENTILQMTELILQNYNHPSICFWGIENEITIGGDGGEPLNKNLAELNDLCHNMDPTRLTTLANVSMVEIDHKHNYITDVLSYNLYLGWYGGDVEETGSWLDIYHAKNPDRPLGISEYGAEGNIRLHSDDPKCRDYSEEYHALYHEKMLEIIEARPYLWSTHVWNMFEFASDMRDEGGVAGRNNKGLVTFDRTVKKDAFYAYKAHWTTAPFVHICGRRYAERCGDTTRIKVFATGVDSVTLFVNGEERASSKGEHVFDFNGVALSMGDNTIKVIGYLNGIPVAEETIRLTRVDTPNESYRLPEEPADDRSGAANWFIEEGSENKELQFVDGCFSVNDKIGEILKNEEAAKVMALFQGGAGGGKGHAVNKMIENFALKDLIKMAGTRVPKGALYSLNEILNKIPK